MTTLLEKAVKKVSRLSNVEQDEIAKIILEEIEDEKLWRSKFKKTYSNLTDLASEAVREHKAGKAKDMD